MTRKDIILLLEAADDLQRMNQTLVKLTGLGYASGDFIKLDNIYEVIRNNSHKTYLKIPEAESREASYKIITNRNLTVEKKADNIF